jgi:hypothetical protein
MHAVAKLAKDIEEEDSHQVEEAMAEQDCWGKEEIRREMERCLFDTSKRDS